MRFKSIKPPANLFKRYIHFPKSHPKNPMWSGFIDHKINFDKWLHWEGYYLLPITIADIVIKNVVLRSRIQLLLTGTPEPTTQCPSLMLLALPIT